MATSINITRRAFINLIPVGILAVEATSASPAQALSLSQLISGHWSIHSQLEDMCGKADPNDPAYDEAVAEIFEGLATAEFRTREALLSHRCDTLESVREKLTYMMRPDVGLHQMMTEDDVELLLSSFA